MLHHVCQINIDNSFYNDDFEKFCLAFRCSECMNMDETNNTGNTKHVLLKENKTKENRVCLVLQN